MNPARCGRLMGLALALAAGAGPTHASAPAPSVPIRVAPGSPQESERVARALAKLRSESRHLGFRPGEDLLPERTFTNPQGRTVVRLAQTFEGHRVWGATAIAHVDAEGQPSTITRGLKPGALPTQPRRLDASTARAIALKDFAPKGELRAMPEPELVVFPSTHTDGLKWQWNDTTRAYELNRKESVLTAVPSDPFVWAYEVRLVTLNKQDGAKEMVYVVDATTGAILKKRNDVKRHAVGDTPETGTGKSQYSGTVPISTTKVDDGVNPAYYTLIDTTRATAPSPAWTNDDGSPIIGIQTFWEQHTPDNPWTWGLLLPYKNPLNAWGDGQPFLDWPHESDENGQTAAVDAHYGVATTWDLLKNVFGWNGFDNQSTSPVVVTHYRNPYTGDKFDNAFWMDSMATMFFGDGTYAPDTIWGIPGQRNGMMSLTELDIAAHELGHGVTSSSAALSYGGESGGLNEAASDILGTMAEAYANRGAGDPLDVIPAGGHDWLLGAKSRPIGPLRNMQKPSNDFVSADAWFNALGWLDVHFNSGPMNRAFYFLSQGASNQPGRDDFSPYLTSGMTGLGNDKAFKIWFKALTEHMLPMDGYAEARAALLTAAGELYGATEVDAVKSAFAAINVGEAPGMAPRPRVVIPQLNFGGFLGRNPDSLMAHTFIVPQGEDIPLLADVENTSDKRVTWRTGGTPGMYNTPLISPDTTPVGRINPNGTWTAPQRMGWWVLTAVSQADPNQFACNFAITLNLDTDDDSEQDAIDMGSSALSWWAPRNLKPNASPYGGPWVEDMDANFFQVAIKNVWDTK